MVISIFFTIITWYILLSTVKPTILTTKLMVIIEWSIVSMDDDHHSQCPDESLNIEMNQGLLYLLSQLVIFSQSSSNDEDDSLLLGLGRQPVVHIDHLRRFVSDVAHLREGAPNYAPGNCRSTITLN